MAETLGVMGSIIAIIQISEQVIKYSYGYFRTAKNAHREIQSVVETVSTLKGILEGLQTIVEESPNDPCLRNLQSLTTTFRSCEMELRKLSKSLGVEVQTHVNAEKVDFKGKAKWPFQKKEIVDILKTIANHKETFILATTSDNLEVSRQGIKIATQISTTLQNMVLDQKDKEVLRWLTSVDTFINHDIARKKHESTTGNWFIESDLFVKWTDATNASLWIQGIPGAGKTILCSTVIEHVKKVCEFAPLDQYAYFYFDFNDKRTVVDMLRSVIAQLCHNKGLPSELYQLYEGCNNGGRRPREAQLLKAFPSLLATSYRTFVILDALDECTERSDLLEAIKQFIEMSKSLNLLVTSRKEKDILEKMPTSFKVIDLKEGGISEDIRLHVNNCIKNDSKFGSWPLSIKQEIQSTLEEKAQGM